MNDLKINFLGVEFANPLILPSGIAQEIPAHQTAIDAGVGGITLKSLTVEPREGNPLPRVIKYNCGVLNSVGVRNPGISKGLEKVDQFIKQSKVPVIVSIFATKIADFKTLAKEVIRINPVFIEINLSCPNTVDELGESLGIIGVESTKQAVAGVRQVVGKKVKLIAKLSPNVNNIDQIAKSAEAAGADAISAINTVGPGMVIDIEKRKPVLGNKEGGVSGPGIKPIAIRCIYDIYEAVDIPIIGMGGVSSWEDAVEIMMAGATLVGVGSAVYLSGYGVYEKIKEGLREYMRKNKIKSLSELTGLAHQ